MTAPYLLIPIGLILLILYAISLLFSRLELLSKSAHRKIWNYCLLATFLVAAILGTVMAVQVNYKIEVPWTEIVLKWHVNFGLAMSVVGIFHLLWHGRYYFPARSGGRNSGRPLRASRTGGPQSPPDPNGPQSPPDPNGPQSPPDPNGPQSPSDPNGPQSPPDPNGPQSPPIWHQSPPARPNGPVTWPFLIGFSGIAFQTFMIREMLGLFQGNELMLSLILFVWLLITGAGALNGNRARTGINPELQAGLRKSLVLVLTLVILPLFSVPLMYYCKNLFFAPGIEAGPIAFTGFLLLILTPFCFLNGFAFTYTARVLQPSGLNIRKAYAWESFGGASAGIVCTAAILAGILTPPAGRRIEKLFHPNDEIVATRSGPTGRVTITRKGDQVNIFENGILAQSSGNTLVCEEMAHFAMIQHPDPRNILVIGGLLSGITQELSKYPCQRIDLAEPDPQFFRLAKRLNLVDGPVAPFRHIRKNLPAWINHPDTQYDVILVMLPGPQNLRINRFYTAEFFNRLKHILVHDGIISVMLTGTANYVSKEAIAAMGPVVNAMKKSFRQAVLFPGENNYLIGSANLRVDVLSELKSRKIQTLYLSAGYFDEALFKVRMAGLNEAVSAEKTINTDLKPMAYFGQIAWWLRHFKAGFLWLLAVIVSMIVFSSLISGNSAFTGMFIMGAGAAGTEIILLFLMQITAGSLYLFSGLLVATFMAGLALGTIKVYTGLTGKFISGITFILLTFILVTVLLAVLAIWMTKTGNFAAIKAGFIIMLTFGTAWLTGRVFSLLTKILPDTKSGGKLYVYDMLGAASGVLVYPMVVIPIFGILPAIGMISISGVLILILLKARRN